MPVVSRILDAPVEAIHEADIGDDLGGQAHEGTLGVYRVQGSALSMGGTERFTLIVKHMRAGENTTLARQIERECRLYAEPSAIGSCHVFRPARFWGQHAAPDGSRVLFLEDLGVLHADRWSDEDYIATALALGRFHGTSQGRDLGAHGSTGESAIRRFAAARPLREIIGRYDVARTAHATGPLDDLLAAAPVDRFLQLWRQSDAVFKQLGQLPRVLNHGDCHALNLFLKPGTGVTREVVAIDWAYVGPGGVGEDPGSLITAEFVWRRMGVERFRALERRVFDAYLRGLRAEGFAVDEGLVRLGFLAVVVADAGLRMLLAISRLVLTPPPGDEETDTRATLTAYAERMQALTPYFDEARKLSLALGDGTSSPLPPSATPADRVQSPGDD